MPLALLGAADAQTLLPLDSRPATRVLPALIGGLRGDVLRVPDAALLGTAARGADPGALGAWLDAQPQVDKSKKIGTQGYCMGGPLIVKTAATVPNRVGAAASFHGGGLTTAAADSPHLLIPKIKARLYFGIASSDDTQQPESKTILRTSLDAAKVQGEVEVYAQAQHGWCMADTTAYHRESAERAWAKLLALYKTALA